MTDLHSDSTRDAEGRGDDTNSHLPGHSSSHIDAHETQRRLRIAFVFAAILAVQIPTTVFALVVYRTHQDAALGLTTLFSFALYAGVTCWIRASAKQAFWHARQSGHLTFLKGKTVRVAHECPRRWLVILHMGFEGFSSLD